MRTSDPAALSRLGQAQQHASLLNLQRSHGNARVSRLVNAVQRNPTSSVQRLITVAEAKSSIKKASSGWGTDEGRIYTAIRECADRATLKADPEVQAHLRGEMKSHELWKAYLLLEFGKESAFPPVVRAIWGATESWGTDEARIYKALNKLKSSQLVELLQIPGIRDMLQGDLNKGEMKRATLGVAEMTRHKKNVDFVKNELADMKKPASPALIRNTAQWMEPTAGGTPKIELFVLTKTHDAKPRADKHGKAGEVAYFGDTPKYPADTADYDLDITSKRDIHFSGSGVVGEHQNKKIWLMEPKAKGSASVRGTLVHEVQHDADRHEDEPDWAKAYKSPEESWVRYKTEFRAYWIDGDFNANSDATGTATDAKFDNAKQEAVFLHLYGTSATDTYAEFLRPNYDGNTTVGGKKFQDLVHGYKQPEGVNLINSPQIDTFYNELDKCSKTDRNFTRSPLKELLAAAQTLTVDDQTYVNSATAAALQKMTKKNLAARPLKRIAKIMNGGALPRWAGGR